MLYFVVDNMTSLWELQEKSQTTPPDKQDVDLVTALTDATRVGRGCDHSCSETFQLFPYAKSQAGMEITCDITLQRHWAVQQNEGGVGMMKKRPPNMDFLGGGTSPTNVSYYGRFSPANEGSYHPNRLPHTQPATFYYLKLVCLLDLLYSTGP